MKSPFKLGFAGGFILGIMVSVSMDMMLGGSLGGGWGEAVSNDIHRLFNIRYPTSHPVVLFGIVAVIGFVGMIGGLMGGFFISLITRFYAEVQKRASQEELETKNQDP